MKHYSARSYAIKPQEVKKQWIVIDAKNAVLGRAAAKIVTLLTGKSKAYYTPHVDCGDNVIVINAEQVKLTGKKYENDIFYWHTGYPGGVNERTMKQRLTGKFPERVLRKSVERMLPKESPLARKQLSNLYVYAGNAHPHEGQTPVAVNLEDFNTKNKRDN